MAKRTSKHRTTFYATLVLAFICALPWLLPGCEFEVNPTKGRNHFGFEINDTDGGE